jgi:acetyl esterase/lipase
MILLSRAAVLVLVSFYFCPVLAAEPTQVLALWPKEVPGEQANIGEEKDTTKPTDDLVGGKRLIRLGNVSRPTISVYPAPAPRNTRTAVLVCPGGGYHILAMDLEGTEVCEWLNSIGVTGILLKHRVPKREGLEKHTAALQDAQRAMGLVREHAAEWGIDPQRIGVLGFSAGGHLSAMVSNHPERTYPIQDGADSLSCRPDFTILVYPAYLTLEKENDRVAPELNLTPQTPAAFLIMAQDDPVRVENVLFYAAALKKAGVPFELHVYPTGGHGYGLRPSKHQVTSWPDRATEWMRARGLLDPKQ